MFRAIVAAVFVLLTLNVLAINTDLAGTWKGTYETPGGPGKMELTLSHQGTEWKAVVKFPEVEDENTFTARDLKVSDNEVLFNLEVDNKTGEVRFSGKPAGDKIEGSSDRLMDGEKVYTGRWSTERAKEK